jgi:hypothetical protein
MVGIVGKSKEKAKKAKRKRPLAALDKYLSEAEEMRILPMK